MTLPTFPVLIGLKYPFIRTAEWDVDVQRSISGKRTTLSNFSYPIYHYELSYSVLRADVVNKEFQTLMAFYNSVGGPANLFQFNDPGDQSVTAQGFGVGDGATLSFQLVRSLAGLGANWVDPVFGPVGTPAVYDNGVLKSTPADYSIGASGLVTFTSAPVAGHVLSWTGNYNWLCRFDDQMATFEQFQNLFWSTKKIALSTEKL
jgi:uncharacterized protein (TIGR02217 family)